VPIFGLDIYERAPPPPPKKRKEKERKKETLVSAGN